KPSCRVGAILYGCPNEMVARTKWLPERNGCPNEMVARTKWLPERNGCPNEMVALTEKRYDMALRWNLGEIK
ncbi:MAG: hypothetical protein DRR08_29855, partial [Candidatus Parabeggiatoa sp. nov. 2]